jgi:hypothetical protein
MGNYELTYSGLILCSIHIVVSRISIHGCLSIYHNFGLHGCFELHALVRRCYIDPMHGCLPGLPGTLRYYSYTCNLWLVSSARV